MYLQCSGSSHLLEVVQRQQSSNFDFQCPEEDRDGSRLARSGGSVNANGSGSQALFQCFYEGGNEECLYFEDGSLSSGSGSSACPELEGSPNTPTSPPETQTQTEIDPITKTATIVDSVTISLPSTPDVPSSSPSLASLTPSIPSTPSSSTASSSSFSSTSTPDVSSTGLDIPAITQSAASGGKKSLTAGSIAGITLGALAVIVLGILVCLFIRTSRRRQRVDLQPTSFTGDNPGVLASEAALDSTSGARLSRSESVTQNRQEYLGVQLHAVRKQLEALQGQGAQAGRADLEQAMEQNEALRDRIRMLERQLRTQSQLQLSDHSPPGYLD